MDRYPREDREAKILAALAPFNDTFLNKVAELSGTRVNEDTYRAELGDRLDHLRSLLVFAVASGADGTDTSDSIEKARLALLCEVKGLLHVYAQDATYRNAAASEGIGFDGYLEWLIARKAEDINFFGRKLEDAERDQGAERFCDEWVTQHLAIIQEQLPKIEPDKTKWAEIGLVEVRGVPPQRG